MTEDARERAMREPWFRAWDKWSNEHDGGDGYYAADGFEIGYGIAKREDEQRIAELVDGLDTVRNALWRYLGGRSARAAAINRAFDASMRALGQSEEVKP